MKPQLLPDQVAVFLDSAGVEQSAPLVAGISGGVDSMTLLHILNELGYSLHVAHVNYGLRGAESDADEAVVRKFCSDAGIKLHVFNPDRDEFAASSKSLQEGARDYRYDRFQAVAQTSGAFAVALAHHADDNAETILRNLFTGTGIEGLAGIPAIRQLADECDDSARIRIVRPLLSVSRDEILTYAHRNNLTWREDESNLNPEYDRGYIRRTIVPAIEERYGPAAMQRIAAAGTRVRKYLDEEHTDKVEELFGIVSDGEHRLDTERMRQLDPVWRKRIALEAVRKWCPDTRADTVLAERIVALLDAQPGRTVAYPEMHVVRDREVLVFRNGPSEEPYESAILEEGKCARWMSGLLRADRIAQVPATPELPSENYALASGLTFPLVVRGWKAGDAMCMFGSGMRKKVSDILTDSKVPPSRRKQMPVVCSGETIFWIPGVARGEDFKIEADSSEVILLTYIQSEYR